MNRFGTFFDAYYAYFTAKPHQLKKTLGQFENLVFEIMSTRENTVLIARTSLTFKLQRADTKGITAFATKLKAKKEGSKSEIL